VVVTPFKGLNKLLKKGGFPGGELVILAAAPSTGKSEMALNIASYTSMDEKKDSFIYSLEMRKEGLLERVLLSKSQINSMKLERGYITAKEHSQLCLAAEQIKASKLYFEDNLSADIFDVIASIRKVYNKYKLSLVIIDYLQLIKYPTKVGTRNDELSAITRLLKHEAVRLNIPFLVLSQLSRRHIIEGREPDLHDLRDSGAIEQDADCVVFLHATPAERRKDVITKTKASMRKQRDGPVGEI
jgi:replicative DNA helicase